MLPPINPTITANRTIIVSWQRWFQRDEFIEYLVVLALYQGYFDLWGEGAWIVNDDSVLVLVLFELGLYGGETVLSTQGDQLADLECLLLRQVLAEHCVSTACELVYQWHDLGQVSTDPANEVLCLDKLTLDLFTIALFGLFQGLSIELVEFLA